MSDFVRHDKFFHVEYEPNLTKNLIWPQACLNDNILRMLRNLE